MNIDSYRSQLAAAQRNISRALATCSQLKTEIRDCQTRCDKLIERTDALINRIEARDPHFFDRRRA